VKTLTLSFVTLLLAALLTSTAACGGRELPPYAHWRPDGSLEIRVEEADPNASYSEDYRAIVYEYGNYTCTYGFSGLRFSDSTRSVSISNSPYVVPGDGVLDLFAAVWTDAADNMNVGLFIDTDWKQVEGQLYLLTIDLTYVSENGEEKVLSHVEREPIPLDLSDAIEGVLFYKVAPFPQVWDYCPPVNLAVTNVAGEYIDVLRSFHIAARPVSGSIAESRSQAGEGQTMLCRA
jgi:hypothetical protein